MEFEYNFSNLDVFARGYRVTPGATPPIYPGWVDFELASGFVLRMNMPEHGETFKRVDVSCGAL